ncbi:MAG TPA: trypsin-like peptidase domain-containing protein [Candidatus Acidoferrum sp.]|nr:trypsin-like peptidase domain-containing protein [Candidatus Acidoferrum sp.]
MRSRNKSVLSGIGAAILMLSAVVPMGAASPQQAGGAQKPEHPAQFRVVRSMCGSKGVTHGSEYQLQDQRNTFHVPGDHQIVVYFEWEGPPGAHHAVGSWRSPDGRVVLNSEFDLSSPSTHYIGTWTLAIPDTIATGLWALEATIDGEPAGTQTFEIVSDRSAAPPVPAGPPMPTPGEVYQRAAAASVLVTSLDQNGDAISHGLGFFLEKNLVLTAFQVIDGASSLTVDLADGSHATINDLVAWNRSADWAILKVDSAQAQPLEKAAANSWRVGDLCYVLASLGQGSRTIQSVNITGLMGMAPAAQRLTISSSGAQETLGAPVLDSYGRLIGVLSGGLAGMGSSRMGNWTSYLDLEAGTVPVVEPSVLPTALIPEAAMSQQPVTLSDLAARGTLMMPLSLKPQVATGSLSQDFKKMGGEAIFPVGSGSQFSRKQGTLAVVAVWGPTKKMKGTQQLRIYSVDNQLVAETPPGKLELSPRVTLYSAWKVAINSLQPGVYRVDVLADDEPQWRHYFRVIE